MASIPKVKITFDADLDGLKRGTAAAENELDGFGKSVAKFGEMAKAAFAAAAAAAAAYAVKLGVDGVKAAIEDEQAQARLAKTLENAAGATNAQVKATEAFISKMQMATGVSDNDLRAAMGRLTLSTNDVTKSQELLQLALDISAGTGKSVESVSNALGKAYDGQTTALGKLGIGLSSTELKGKSFTDVQQRLSDLFGGAAARNADTFQGKIDIMKQRFGEFQESVGNKVIPILMNLFQMIDTKVVPAFDWLKKNAIDPVTDAIMRNKDTFAGLADFLGKTLVPFIGGALALALAGIGKAASFIVETVAFGIRALEPLINFIIDRINNVIRGINLISPFKDIPSVPNLNTSKITIPSPPKFTPTNVSGTSVSSTGTGGGTSGGGSGVSGAASSVAAAAATGLTAAELAGIPRSGSAAGTAGAAFLNANPNVNIYVQGPSIIDEAGFTQSVIQAFNNGTYRGTAGAGMLAGLAI